MKHGQTVRLRLGEEAGKPALHALRITEAEKA
jgi:hypothetical protein